MSNFFKQANAFAMQYGLVMGLWGLVTLAAFAGSLNFQWMSFLSTAMAAGSLFLASRLTARFRDIIRHPGEGFTVSEGFLFTFVSSIYAALCIAFGVYVYLAYVDGGWLFDQYQRLVTSPLYTAELRRNGMEAQINSMTGGEGMKAMVDALRSVPAIQYACMVIYFTFLSSPIISFVIALICKRRSF